jgi:NADPH-dependent 2,4-dienoyl-CoA reductase/sulfur reductase-like enzyme
MAEALRHRQLDVTLIERLPEVMPTVDPPIGSIVRGELERHGVEVLTGATVSRIEPGLDVVTSLGDRAADVVLVVTGVRPDTALAQDAGASLGAGRAIAVDRHMQTGVDGVWAAGIHASPATCHADVHAAEDHGPQARARGRRERGRRLPRVRGHAGRQGLRHHGMAVDALNDLDLSYTPPFSAPWDPVQAAAQAWIAATGSPTASWGTTTSAA